MMPMQSDKPKLAQPQGDRLKLRDMMWAFTASQAVCAAAKLGIVDVLDRPKTPSELAETIAADEPVRS